MNSRDVALFSAAAVFGAVSTAVAFTHFFNSREPKKRCSPQNGVVKKKPSRQNPFDPAKRNGSVVFWNFVKLLHSIYVKVAKREWLLCVSMWVDFIKATFWIFGFRKSSRALGFIFGSCLLDQSLWIPIFWKKEMIIMGRFYYLHLWDLFGVLNDTNLNLINEYFRVKLPKFDDSTK